MPRWGRMWLLALGIYALCKWLTWRRASERRECAGLAFMGLFIRLAGDGCG